MADSFLKSFAAELATVSTTWGAILPLGLHLSCDQKRGAVTKTGVGGDGALKYTRKFDRLGQ